MRLPASLVLLLLFGVTVSCSRILMFPFDHQAHVNFFSVIGEELHGRGHEVDIIVAERSEHLAKQKGINTIPVAFEKIMNSSYFEYISSLPMSKQYEGLSILCGMSLSHVRHIMNDKAMLRKLQSNKYDLALMEGSDVSRSTLLMPYKLGLKFITIDVRHDPWYARVPALPSVEGVPLFFFLDENSTFYERLINAILFVFTHALLSPPSYLTGITDELFTELVPDLPNIGFETLFQDSEMFLIVMDVLCTDAHRVSAPHYQFVGALGARDSAPLPKNLKEFMDSAKDGAIIMTFGSGLKRVPMEMLDKLLPVFGGLKQKVVMRHDGETPPLVPKNVLIQTWLPQNDLLGHPNTKLFITHAGNNGQLEAVYHGIPMLMMPFLGDQFYNTKRAIKRRYGLEINPKDFTKEEFETTILELLNNPTYYDTIHKCSKILHSLPSPKENAAFWIEHVLQFGSSHLKPYYLNMPLWKFFMLDILAFLIVIDVVILAAIWLCCRKCRKKLAKKKSKKE